MISADELDRIREATPIREFLAARGYDMERGPRYGCPLHGSERGTPFAIYEKGTRWTCHAGCGSGDVLDLVRRIDGTTFREAAESLGAQSEPGTYQPHPEVSKRKRERARQKHDQRRANQLVASLEPWEDYQCDFWEASPIRIDWPAEEDAARWVGAFYPPEGTIWNGRPQDSGQERHGVHFKPASEWLADGFSGAHVSTAIHEPGSISRCAETVRDRLFLVVESDDLDKPRQASLIRWLAAVAGLPLAAVLDSGNRSLHAWFRWDSEAADDLRDLAPALKIDPAMLNPSQPARLPGFRHQKSDRRARALYLDPTAEEAKRWVK